MERKHSQRMYVVEKTFAETNKRLDDVLKSNLTLPSMLQSVLYDFCRSDVRDKSTLPRTDSTAIGNSSRNADEDFDQRRRSSSGYDGSEKWWDSLCKSTSDEGEETEGARRKEVSNPRTSTR